LVYTAFLNSPDGLIRPRARRTRAQAIAEQIFSTQFPQAFQADWAVQFAAWKKSLLFFEIL